MRFDWNVSTTPPGDWDALIKHCGGGFFHTPAAVGVSLPEGEMFYAIALVDRAPAAIAFGTRTLCRLSYVRRHAIMATPPAARAGVDSNAAADSLAHALAADGAAQVEMHSFDAPATDHGQNRRVEHRVGLKNVSLEACSSTHRRHIRRGEQESWSLRKLVGVEAVERLCLVQQQASARAQERGRPFVASPAIVAGCGAALNESWGTCCFACYADDLLLNVILIGWANGRAFYLLGGSTPEGYRRSAAAWTQWRMMQLCAAAGHELYNLGGTPAGAEDPSHASHGLYRFKSAFGSERVFCGGHEWVFRPAHVRAHRLLGLGARLARRRTSHHNSE